MTHLRQCGAPRLLDALQGFAIFGQLCWELTGGLRPYAPAGWLAAILGVSALLALVALSVPTRQALRTRPVEAIGIRE